MLAAKVHTGEAGQRAPSEGLLQHGEDLLMFRHKYFIFLQFFGDRGLDDWQLLDHLIQRTLCHGNELTVLELLIVLAALLHEERQRQLNIPYGHRQKSHFFGLL